MGEVKRVNSFTINSTALYINLKLTLIPSVLYTQQECALKKSMFQDSLARSTAHLHALVGCKPFDQLVPRRSLVHDTPAYNGKRGNRGRGARERVVRRGREWRETGDRKVKEGER